MPLFRPSRTPSPSSRPVDHHHHHHHQHYQDPQEPPPLDGSTGGPPHSQQSIDETGFGKGDLDQALRDSLNDWEGNGPLDERQESILQQQREGLQTDLLYRPSPNNFNNLHFTSSSSPNPWTTDHSSSSSTPPRYDHHQQSYNYNYDDNDNNNNYQPPTSEFQNLGFENDNNLSRSDDDFSFPQIPSGFSSAAYQPPPPPPAPSFENEVNENGEPFIGGLYLPPGSSGKLPGDDVPLTLGGDGGLGGGYGSSGGGGIGKVNLHHSATIASKMSKKKKPKYGYGYGYDNEEQNDGNNGHRHHHRPLPHAPVSGYEPGVGTEYEQQEEEEERRRRRKEKEEEEQKMFEAAALKISLEEEEEEEERRRRRNKKDDNRYGNQYGEEENDDGGESGGKYGKVHYEDWNEGHEQIMNDHRASYDDSPYPLPSHQQQQQHLQPPPTLTTTTTTDEPTNVSSSSASGSAPSLSRINSQKLGNAAALEAMHKFAASQKQGQGKPQKQDQQGDSGGVGGSGKPTMTQQQHQEEEESDEEESGGGGGPISYQEKLIGLAMNEAAKLFDKKGGGNSAEKQEAIQSAARTGLKLFKQYQASQAGGKPGTGGGGPGIGPGDVQQLIGQVVKLF